MNTVVYNDGSNRVCELCDTIHTQPGQRVTYTSEERVVNRPVNTITTTHYVTQKDTGGSVTYDGADSN